MNKKIYIWTIVISLLLQRRKVKDFFIKFTNKLHFAESRCEADA